MTLTRRGLAERTTSPTTNNVVSAGEGGTTSFDLSANTGVLTNLLSAGGAYDAYRVGSLDIGVDWSGGGRARGGFKGGLVHVPGDLTKVVSYYNIKGGDGGQFLEQSAEGPGASSMWGSGPAPGGGGSGYAKKDTFGQEVAQAGDGIVIVEEL